MHSLILRQLLALLLLLQLILLIPLENKYSKLKFLFTFNSSILILFYKFFILLENIFPIQGQLYIFDGQVYNDCQTDMPTNSTHTHTQYKKVR